MPPRHRRAGSALSNRGHDDERWVSNSLASNTSVNIANAFASARTSTNPAASGSRMSRSPNPPPSLSLPSLRARTFSPAAELVQASAQAQGPASYFLTAEESDVHEGNSRRSLSMSSASHASDNGDDSYRTEENFVLERRQRRGNQADRHDHASWNPHMVSDDDSGAASDDFGGIHRNLDRARGPKPARRQNYKSNDATPRRVLEPTPVPSVPSVTRQDGRQVLYDNYNGDVATPTATPIRGGSSRRRQHDDWFGDVRRAISKWWASRELPTTTDRRKSPWTLGKTMATIAACMFLIMTQRWLFSGSKSYAAPKSLPSSPEEYAKRLIAVEGQVQQMTKKAEMERYESNANFEKVFGSLSKLQTDIEFVRLQENENSKAIKTVRGDMVSLDSRVKVVEKDIRASLDDGRIAAALVRILPRHLPVRYDAKGALSIDPSFYAELKKLFVGKGNVEDTVRRMISGGVQTPSAERWNINEYEIELEQWGYQLFDRYARDNSNFVSREEFLKVLEKELAAVKDEVKVTFRTLEPGAMKVKTADGEDMTAALEALIDAALLRYSKDTLSIPDFALFSAGARVIPETTTSTLVLQQPSRLGKWIRGDRAIEGLTPATALIPDNSVGNCWPFKGAKGQLGIMLARRAIINAVTVEHAPHETSFDMSTAPKQVEVWATIEGEENQEKARQYLKNRASDPGRQPDQSISMPQSPENILLATFTYDILASTPLQTFPVPADIVEMGIDVGIVVVRIESNWGGDLTCLYRVRVHGEAVKSGSRDGEEEAGQDEHEEA